MAMQMTDKMLYEYATKMKSLTLYWNSQETVQFFNDDNWGFIWTISIAMLFLIIGNILIASIPCLKRSLLPSPVLGGLLYLAFNEIYKVIDGKDLYNRVILEMFSYHFLAIGVTATGFKRIILKKGEVAKQEPELRKKQEIEKLDSGLLLAAVFYSQILIGIIITLILYYAMDVYPVSGCLLGMGFAQGPTAALVTGQNMENQKFDDEIGNLKDGKNMGMAIAALGFVAATIGGLIYLNVQKCKGNKKFTVAAEEIKEKNTLAVYETENDISSTGNIDKFSIQVGLTLIAYFLAYLLMRGLHEICMKYGFKKNGDKNFLITGFDSLIWSLNMVFGLVFAKIIKAIIELFERNNIIQQNYINNYQMDRLSGFCYDLLTVAAFGAIRCEAFGKTSFVVSLIILFIVGSFGTFFYVYGACCHLYNGIGELEEHFLTFYGTLTGTASTGFILLRQIDPFYKTGAQRNLVNGTGYLSLFLLPLTLLVMNANEGWKKFKISVGIIAGIVAVLNIALFRRAIFCRGKITDAQNNMNIPSDSERPLENVNTQTENEQQPIDMAKHQAESGQPIKIASGENDQY